MRYLFLPDRCQYFILGPELVDPDHLPAKFTAQGVVDQHAVALELPADRGARGINCTCKTLACRILPHEFTSLMRRLTRSFVLIDKFVRNLVRKLRLHVHEKEFIRDPVAAIVIPVAELPFNPDELPKTLAAFPTPFAIELGHSSQLISAKVIDKFCDNPAENSCIIRF
jgi:hypothetical protein